MKRTDESGSRVRRLIWNDRTYDMVGSGIIAGESYWDVSPYSHPVAMNLGDTPVAAWINEDQTISLDAGLGAAETLAEDGGVMSLTLVASEGDQPVVLYGSTSGVFVERPGAEPIAVDECQPEAGVYLSFTSAFTTVSGYWLGAWTKYGPPSDEDEGYLTTDGLGLFCGEDDCVLQERECASAARNNLIRNPSTAIVRRADTSPGLVEVVAATPLIAPGEEPGTISSGIAISQESVDLGDPPFQGEAVREAIAPPFPLSVVENAEAPDYRGPDWPVVVHLPPDRYLVAWIEPADDEDSDALRIQRYRMCLP
jgi:hypothetical protein